MNKFFSYANTEYNSDIGGGVFHTISGTLNITASTFDGNTSANYGGTLHTNKTAVTIDGETVIKNSTGATGAAMHMRSAKVTVDNISITDNTSNLNGVIYYSGSDLTLKNVIATGNKAVSGGVLFVNNSIVTIQGSNFSNNQATNGGVLYSKGGATLNLENTAFTENTASYGGAIHLIENSKLNLTGATFTKNSATKDGGAIYNKASTVTAVDTETAKNVFDENSAESHGGAIYVVYTTDEATQRKLPGVLTVTGGTFTNNTAIGGGAVSVRTDCEASFNGTTFIGNQVSGDDGKLDGYSEGGGAVYVGYGKLTMNNITARKNISKNYGGMVHLLDAETTITNSTFTENEAGDGGAIWTKDGGTLSITDSTFTGNKATASAGAVYVAKSIAGELNNLVFDGNTAGTNGGALYLAEAAVTTEKLDMQNNAATGNGGAVYVNGMVLNVTADDIFKGNSAGGHGGAVYLVYNADKVGASLIGTNAVFENNTAKAGGAISSRSYCNIELTGGALRGNNSTAPQSDSDRLGGGAIYTNANTLKLHGVTVENNTCEYYGGAIFASGATVTIDEKSVLKGNGAITGVALYLYSSGSATLNDVTITNNIYTKGSSNGVIYASGSVTLEVEKVTATGNKSVNGGVFYCSGTVSGTIKDSEFTSNTATGNGGVIDFRSSKTLDITGCTFTKNTAKNGGAIYCENGTINVSDSLTENTATASGGAISVAGKGVVNLLATATLSANSAPIGGAVYLNRGGTVEINGATLEGNSATGSGGAIAATDTPAEGEAPVAATLNLIHATLKNNTAKYGGAVYMDNSSNVTVTNGTMTNNTANLGGAVYNCNASLTLADAVFTQNHAQDNGGAIDLVGGTATGTATFERNTAVSHAGAIYVTYIKGENGEPNIGGNANLTGGAFIENTAMGGGAVSIRTGSTATFENMTFQGNCVSGYKDDGKDETINDNDGDGEGGGAIYVGYGSVSLINCTGTDNESTDSFGGFLDSVQGVVAITGGTYSGNSAPAGGVIYSIYNSKITVDGALISENESTFVNPYKVEDKDTYDNKKGGGAFAMINGTLTISNTTLDGNKSCYYGGTILGSDATITINNQSVVTATSGKTGAAIYFTGNGKNRIENSSILDNKASGSGVIYIGSGTLDMVNVTASGNTANTGGVLNASNSGVTVNITGGTYTTNSATYGGVVYVYNGAAVNLNGATFTKNSATKDGGAIYNSGGALTGTGANVFTENTAANHGGAIYVSYTTNTDGTKNGGVLTMTGGTFDKNVAVAGGAISARSSCVLNLTGTTFTENEATSDKNSEGGGAIYVGYGSATLEDCYLEGNSTGFYGGAISSVGSTLEIKGETEFKKNHGATGLAVHLRDGGIATINGAKFTENVVGTTTGNGGAVYITGTGTLNMTDVIATGNTNANGGVLYASGSAKLNISGGTFSGNTAIGNGGVFDIRTNGKSIISGGTYSNNTAKTGGAIYIDTGAVVTITGATLDGNTSTADGGAIYVADSTKNADVATTLVMTGATLQNNKSGARGGALATDSGSPLLVIKVTDCTFQKNTSTTSGGAVCIQNTSNTSSEPTAVTVVFTNCTFLENSSKTDGGALDVRSGGCLKIDGITAKKNTAKSNAGVVYVTSVNSRLYITGEVLLEDNSASNGAFSYLYNNNYTNPPKIYTTHANTAAWYASVAGNKTNVVFDMTTLP